MTGIAALLFSQDEAGAHAAFKKVFALVHDRRIHLETATVGVRQADGVIAMEEAETWLDATESNWNRFWHRTLHRHDAHDHDDEFIKELGDKLTPGDAAVFVSFELKFRSEVISEISRLSGTVISVDLTTEQRAEMLAEIHAADLAAENKSYKKMEKGELLDKVAEDGIQNIE